MKYHVDFSVQEAERTVKRVYPELHPVLIGETKSHDYLVFEIDFPDGTFYFQVNERTVSPAFTNLDDAVNR